MNSNLLDQIVHAVLYEGYILYPYRPTSQKNQRERFTFGRVYPPACSASNQGVEPNFVQTECLVHCPQGLAGLRVTLRFLQPIARDIGSFPAPLPELPRDREPAFQSVPSLCVAGNLLLKWQEARERQIKIPWMPIDRTMPQHISLPFSFPASRDLEPVLNENGAVAAVIVRHQDALAGHIQIGIQPAEADCFKITVRVLNESTLASEDRADPIRVLMRTFASTHLVLQVENAEFISLIDPPPRCKSLAESCRNIGTWPVLVGDEAAGEHDTVLSAPIILYDYPKIAPESPGDFFDGTEVDEMLSLRLMAMPEEEKRELRADDVARRLLERTEALDRDALMKMHGTLRDIKTPEVPLDFFNPPKPLDHVSIDGIELKAGDQVRIRPRNRADAIDCLLAGKTAVIQAVEQDAEDRVHLALVLEDDPGKDLGLLRLSGHRFFYGPDEIEPLKKAVA